MQKSLYILFGLLNIILTPIVPLLIVFGAGLFLMLNEYTKTSMTNGDIALLFFTIGILSFYYIFKIIALPLIALFSEKNKYIHKFFDKIEKDKIFCRKVLCLAFLTDITIILVWLIETILYNVQDLSEGFIFCYLISGGGLFVSYLSLVVWFKVKRQNREVDERDDRQICD